MRYSLLTACLFAWLLGAAAPAYAQPAKVVIDSVRVGFITGTSSGAFKTSQWAPVYVSITAGPERIDRSTGVIVVEASDTDDVQNQYTIDLPPLAAGEAGLVITYVRPGNTGSDINVTIKERPPGIKVFASTKQLNQTFDGMAPVNVLYVTAGARPRSLKSAFTIKKQPNKPEEEQEDVGETGLYHFGYIDNVGQLPTRWFGYGAVDVLVLMTGTQSFIEELIDDKNDIVRRQRDALVEWIRRGGRLVISTGRNQQFVAQLLAKLQIIDCAITGVATRDSLPGVSLWAGAKEPFVNKPRAGQESKLEFAKLEPDKGVEGIAWPTLPPQKGDRPVIVQAPCGLGRVVLIGFDLDQAPFTSWNGQEAFWKKLDHLVGPKGTPNAQEMNRQMPSFGWSG